MSLASKGTQAKLIKREEEMEWARAGIQTATFMWAHSLRMNGLKVIGMSLKRMGHMAYLRLVRASGDLKLAMSIQMSE
jgi:hypothetical protein